MPTTVLLRPDLFAAPPPSADVEVDISTMTVAQVNTAITNSLAGDVISFAPGTYTGLATIVPKTGQTYLARDGLGTVTLNGNQLARRAFDGQFGPNGVTLRGLIITNYWNSFEIGGSGPTFSPIGGGVTPATGITQLAIVHVADTDVPESLNWVIEDCEIVANYGKGIQTGNGTRISRCEISDNAHIALSGPRQDLILEDSSLRNNARWHMGASVESGAVKWGGGATLPDLTTLPPNKGHIVRRCTIANNWGPGLWFDWDCVNSEIHNNSIWGNSASAIILEGCGGFHVHHNQLESPTGSGDPFGSFKVGFSFQNSKKTTFENNLIVVRQDAMWLGDQNRQAGGGGTPQGGLYVGWFTGTQNNIDNNVYLMINNGAFYSVLDTHGQINTNIGCTGFFGSTLQNTEDTKCYLEAPPEGEIVLNENPATSNYRCFLPASGDNHYNVSTNNTYRIASGTPSRWSFDTGHTILANPSGYVPDWEVVPIWTTSPPGKTNLPRTFYVAPTGSDAGAGSVGDPFATINGAIAAVSDLGAGDTLLLEDGTYTANGTVISKGGSAAGHLAIRARNRGLALIRPTGGNHGIHVQKDYVTLDGLDVSGPNLVFHGIAADRLDGGSTTRGVHHITVRHCVSHDNTISGIGLAYGDYYLVEYNECYGNCHSCPQGIQGSGISIYQAREFDAGSGIHNIVHSNVCHDNFIDYLRNGNGGPFYLVTANAGTDTFTMVSTTAGPPTNASTVRFTAGPGGTLPGGLVAGTNYVIANRQTAPTPDTFQVTLSGVTVDLTSNGSGDIYVEPDHTDANGIILDDLRNSQSTAGSGTIYPHTTLVENNLCYGNGNRGIHLFKSNNCVVKNNTCYNNNLDPLSQGTWREELSNAQASTNTWANNIGVVATATTIAGVTKRAIGDRDVSGDRNTGVAWHNNLTYDVSTPGSNSFIASVANATLVEPPNKFGENPLFADAATGNFRLQAGSPAIDAGTAAYGLATFDLDGNPRVVGAVVDIGAYERQAAGLLLLENDQTLVDEADNAFQEENA